MHKAKTLMLAALSVTLSVSIWAQGGFHGPGRYIITNVKSGKVLDLDRNNQTTVIQFTSRGTENQAWEIRLAREGFFFIRNMMNGNALTVSQDRNGAPLIGTPFRGSEAQMWRFEVGKDGNVLIVSRRGRVLDIPGGTSRDGAPVNVFERNGDSNQRFVLQDARGQWGKRRWDWDGAPPGNAVIRCSSDDGRRAFCAVDTQRGVRMVRQISGSPCEQGRTWGFDRRGIWVDRGCRAEFEVIR